MKFLQKFAIVWIIIVFTLTALYVYFYRPSPKLKFPDFNSAPTITPSLKPAKTLYLVVKVIDGDTVDVNIDGTTQKVRLIGIDAPEISASKNSCYGKEARDFAASTLNNKKVSLISDPTQDDKDKYGRLLRYIYLEDGTFFNQLMIEKGYAREYTYQKPYRFQLEFKKSELNAKENKIGLWNEAVCPSL